MTKRIAFLLLALLLPLAANAAQPSASKPLVAGTDYIEIPGGTPYQPLNGKIEIVEVFAYWCGHCAEFQPLVDTWKAKLPKDVRFTYVPAAFGGPWTNYGKAYYAAETMGLVERTPDGLALSMEARVKLANLRSLLRAHPLIYR